MTRLSIFVSVIALLLAAVAGQNSLLSRTRAESASPAAAPAATVLSYTVLPAACGASDLYVMKYVPADDPNDPPLVASWCA